MDFSFSMGFGKSPIAQAVSSALTTNVIPIQDGSIDSTQLDGATQPDLVVTGTIAEGEAVSVSSSTLTLPTVDPGVVFYDDLENDTIGQPANANSSIGTYTASRTGTLVVASDAVHGKAFEGWGVGSHIALSDLTEYYSYFAYKMNIWPGNAIYFPGGVITPETFPARSSIKFVWASDTPSDFGGASSDSNICAPSHVSENTHKFTGNSHSFGNEPRSRPGVTHDWNNWNSKEAWLKAEVASPASANGIAHLIETGGNGRFVSTGVGQVFDSADIGPAYNCIRFPGWLEPGGTDLQYSTTAVFEKPTRMMIGDHPNVDKCTFLALCTTSNHTSGSFNAVLHLAHFDPTTTLLYAYVWDETDTILSTSGKLLNGSIR